MKVKKRDIERIWKDGNVKIFLSHTSKYKKNVSKIKDDLSDFDISSFVAHNDIEPTKQWQEEIEKALFSMDILVAIMTEDFHNSNWTDQEIGIALGLEKPVIAVRLGRDPYGFIGKYQAVSSDWDNLTDELLKALLKHQIMVDNFIELMKRCRSFDAGNRLAKYLPSIDKLTKEQVQEIIKAFNENDQISGSYGFGGGKEKYGKGLVYHLERITRKRFFIDENDWKLKKLE